MLLKAGIPLSRAVVLLSEQISDRQMKRILTACAEDVKGGMTFAQSLENNGRCIPQLFIETVRAGEESGALETCFCRLKTHYDSSRRIRQKVLSALIYPAFLLVLAAAVVGIVSVCMIPAILSVYETTGEELPMITRALIAVSGFFRNYFPSVLAVLAAAGAAAYVWGKTPSGKLRLSGISLRLPFFGRISRLNAAARFADTFAVLVMSGLTSVRALAVCAESADNKTVGESLRTAVFDLETGKPLSEIIRENPHFPSLMAEMAAVGEESGLLAETMYTAGEYYYGEAYTASERVLSVLEPALTVVMGVLTAFIIIAVYVPMFSMYNGFM